MSKVLRIAGVSVMALGLVLGIALPSLAAPDTATPWADDSPAGVVKGKVLSVDEENQEFVIQSGEQELIISVDEDTKYFKLCVPGRIVALARHQMQSRHQNQAEKGASAWHQTRLRLQDRISQPANVDMPELERPKLKRLHPLGEEAKFSDIAVGDRVAVWLASEESGYLAERVLIIKPTTYASVSGTITNVSSEDKTIAIAVDDGEAITLEYNERTIFVLRGIIQVQPGQSAHAIYDSDNMIAKRVTIGVSPLELAQ